MRMRIVFSVLCYLAIAVNFSCKKEPQTKTLSNQSTYTEKHPFVGAFLSQSGSQTCSGSLINEGKNSGRCVLTAGHCTGINQVNFAFGPDLTRDDLQVAKVLRSSKRTMGGIGGSFYEFRDMAIVWLDKNQFDLAREEYPKIAKNMPTVNETYTQVGYGKSDNPELSQKKRQFVDLNIKAMIDSKYDQYAGARIVAEPPPETIKQAQPGDSGGALIKDQTIYGVASQAGLDNLFSNYSSVAHANAWIKETARVFCSDQTKFSKFMIEVAPRQPDSSQFNPQELDGAGLVQAKINDQQTLACSSYNLESHCQMDIPMLSQPPKIELTAKPLDGWKFSKWDGFACPCENPNAVSCQFEAKPDGMVWCTAQFTKTTP